MDDTLNVIANLFDYQIRNESLPIIPDELLNVCKGSFKIIYIVADSGLGKTTILNELVNNYNYNHLSSINNDDKLASLFKNKEEAIDRLTMAGVSSVPVWFRSFNTISKGEQSRANIAMYLDSHVIIDEFTSNLDRLTARSLAFCIHKYVNKKLLTNVILAGCQYDIIPWLNPSFIYDLNTKSFISTQNILSKWFGEVNNESISFDIDDKKLILRQCDRDRWKHYSSYHYLTSQLLNMANCWEAFIRIEKTERAIGFIAVSPMPSGTIKHAVREHRLVVIPSCQGIGIGLIISEIIAQHHLNKGFKYFTKTTHPRLGIYRDNNNDKWRPTSKNHKSSSSTSDKGLWKHTERICYSHEFVNNIVSVPELIIIKNTNKSLKLSIIANSSSTTNSKLQDDSFIIDKPQEIRKSNIINEEQNTLQLNITKKLPLKLYGTVNVNSSGDVNARINHKLEHFRIFDYETTENAIIAANNFLIKESMNKNTNLYTVSDNKAYIDLSIGNKEESFLIIDIDMINLLKDNVLRERYNRAFMINDKKRIYVENILFPDKIIKTYIDNNKLNHCRNNLIFT